MCLDIPDGALVTIGVYMSGLFCRGNFKKLIPNDIIVVTADEGSHTFLDSQGVIVPFTYINVVRSLCCRPVCI